MAHNCRQGWASVEVRERKKGENEKTAVQKKVKPAWLGGKLPLIEKAVTRQMGERG